MENRESIPCVELRNVVKSFPGVTAVDDVSLKVETGKVFSLLGPSGCGKTTTLRMVAGLETLDEGEVLIDGKVVNDVPVHRRDCSTVFQTLALFPHMTVEQNIAYGLERRKVPKDEIRKRVSEMLELVKLLGMEKRYPAQLSGGQRQRVAIARSLVIRPKILLLDEPLGSLDRKLRKEMQVELRQIQREVGITFLYVTHDQKEALAISDTIAVMEAGRLEQVGTPTEIYQTPRTMFVADFMGATNIFAGRVISRQDGRIELETENGLRILASELNNASSEEVKGVSIHPELIEILPRESGTEGDNRFRGRIVEMVYQGDFIETKLHLEQSGEILTAHLSSKQYERMPSPGEEVIVHWEPQSSNILVG